MKNSKIKGYKSTKCISEDNFRNIFGLNDFYLEKVSKHSNYINESKMHLNVRGIYFL